MKKKKKNYEGWCYFGLVFLIILLILPVAFRMFGKNWYQKEEKKKDLVEVLKCTKEKDTIYSSFINDVPQYLEYKVIGNYTLSSSDGNVLNDDSSSSSVKQTANDIIERVREYAKVTYSDVDNFTTFKVNMSSMQQDKQYVGIFNNLKNQKSYFNSLAFYCSTVTD